MQVSESTRALEAEVQRNPENSGTHFNSFFTGTKVQILTPEELLQTRGSR